MPKTGIEPVRAYAHRILSPARLPISPLRRTTIYIFFNALCQDIFLVLHKKYYFKNYLIILFEKKINIVIIWVYFFGDFMFKYIFMFLLPFLIFAETPKSGMVEFQFGFFKPNIDSESSLTGKPYKDIFGDSGFVYGFESGTNIFSGYGTFSLSWGISKFSVSGKGIYTETGLESKDKTELTLIPIELNVLNYSLDIFQEKFGFPLVLFVKAGFSYTFWRVTNGIGDTSEFENKEAKGGKYGYQYSLGLRFLLDFLDSGTADDFDRDMGVNDSYIFIEYFGSKVDNFGEKGFDLGGSYLTFGLSLAY